MVEHSPKILASKEKATTTTTSLPLHKYLQPREACKWNHLHVFNNFPTKLMSSLGALLNPWLSLERH